MAKYIEKHGFRFNDEGECISFILLDTPLGQKQLDMIATELNDTLGEGDDFEQFVWNTLCEDIEYDGYGNIRFVWKHDIMNWLTETQLQDVSETLNDAFQNTHWFAEWSTVHSFDEQGFETINDVEAYVEAQRECGWTICWDSIKRDIPKELEKDFEEYKTVELLKVA